MTCLIVITNTKLMGRPEKETGWCVPSIVYPFHAFINAGIRMTYCTILGGVSPVDPESVKKWIKIPICDNTLTDTATMKLVANTVPVRDIDASKYDMILFSGGHGAMFDCVNNDIMNRITAQIYQNGGLVAAIGHGVAGLLNVKLNNGKYLVDGKNITSFTRAEVERLPSWRTFPFTLQSKLIEQGASFQERKADQVNVVVSGNIITGQNPNSSREVGFTLVRMYEEKTTKTLLCNNQK